MKYDVFISYSRKDTTIADQICAAFDKAGITYFIDRQGIGGGMEFPKVLAPAIRESEVFLLLASQNAYDSAFTDREITFAFNKKRGEKMLPYIIDETPFPEHLELIFSSNNWLLLKVHPIETRLVDDVLRLLGRTRPKDNTKTTNQKFIVPSTPGEKEIELTRKKKNDKYGFIDKQGNVVIPFEFEFADDFYEGLSRVKKNGKYGFIDKQGNIIIPFDYYDMPSSFSEGLAKVQLGGKCGYINKNGSITIPFMYDDGRCFSESLAPVKNGNKWGFINKQGNMVIPFEYDYADWFFEGLARVGKNNKSGFIDKQGNMVIPFEYENVWRFSEGLAAVAKKKTITNNNSDLIWDVGFIDKQGNIVIPFEYGLPLFGGFNNGLCCISKDDDDHYGFIDKKGKIIIPFIYGSFDCDWDGITQYFDPFHEGLISAQKAPMFNHRHEYNEHSKWGYLDKQGKTVTPFCYSYAGPFQNGRAKVTKKNLFGKEQTFYIDKQGNRID